MGRRRSSGGPAEEKSDGQVLVGAENCMFLCACNRPILPALRHNHLDRHDGRVSMGNSLRVRKIWTVTVRAFRGLEHYPGPVRLGFLCAWNRSINNRLYVTVHLDRHDGRASMSNSLRLRKIWTIRRTASPGLARAGTEPNPGPATTFSSAGPPLLQWSFRRTHRQVWSFRIL
jgi:hypothetical protein